MLVTLGTAQTIGANSNQTFTYSPNSVQKVMIRLDDADWEASSVTIQIGSRTICNGVSSFGLMGLTQLTSGMNQTAGAGSLILDFGSWECTAMDNLYVNIQAVAEVTGVDISAIVDEPRGSAPRRITQYSDNTFTSPNNLYAISFDAAQQAVGEDAYNIEIRNRLYSSAPSLISANTYYQAEVVGNSFATYFGLLNNNPVPMATTYNYSSSAVTDEIITVEAVGSTPRQREQAKSQKAMALASVGQ